MDGLELEVESCWLRWSHSGQTSLENHLDSWHSALQQVSSYSKLFAINTFFNILRLVLEKLENALHLFQFLKDYVFVFTRVIHSRIYHNMTWHKVLSVNVFLSIITLPNNKNTKEF